MMVNELVIGRGKGKGTYTPFSGFAFVNIEKDAGEFWPNVGTIPEIGIDGDCQV
jgi:hypothetical protein